MDVQRTQESRVRRLAKRLGYRVIKSRRAPNALDNFGEFMLVEVDGNIAAAGFQYDASLRDIEAWLRH